MYTLALLELYRVTFDTAYLQETIHRAEQMLELFEDKEQGGYYMTASDGEQLIARPKETYGDAYRGNEMAECSGAANEVSGCDLGQDPASSCFGVLAMMDALYPHWEIVCAAQDGLPDELLQYLKENTAEDIRVLLKTKTNAGLLSQCPPFTRDYPVPETGATYYLCENGACKAPVKSLTELGL